MKRTTILSIILFISMTSFSQSRTVLEEISINAPASHVWDMITNPKYARILGAEFDKGAYVESDWTMGADVHFKYEPDKLISTGTISKLEVQKLIQVDYDFSGFKYNETYTLEEADNSTLLAIEAGPYTTDYEAQIVVWKNWLARVKELSETKK